jgi:hypothetical protein
MIPQLLILWRASSSKASRSGPFNLIPTETDVEAAAGSLDEEKNEMPNLLTTRLSGPFGIDIGMWAYVLSVAAFRIFYVNHWIWRWVFVLALIFVNFSVVLTVISVLYPVAFFR